MALGVGLLWIGAVAACASAPAAPAVQRPPTLQPDRAADDAAADDRAAAAVEESRRPDSAASGGLLDGVLRAPAPANAILGLVLPVSGSPSNRAYANGFLEGVRLGARLAESVGVQVELLVEDNRGTASGSIQGTASVVSRGAAAILGPLSADNVRAAAAAAPDHVTFLSPTARAVPAGRRRTYSLGAGDPAAGRALAELLSDEGLADAVVVHPVSPAETIEAEAFAEAFAALGGVVLERVPYAVGTTTFEEPLMRAEALAPAALVVAAPARDVELLAPQIEFFGLDSAGIQIAGTAAWTADAVLREVASRHTDGVLAISARPPGVAREVPSAFVEAYEAEYRRSLVDAVPAVGFDLFEMALWALASDRGGGGAADPAVSLERLGRFEGLTGTYRFRDGRATREFYPVRIRGGRLHPPAFRLPGPPSPDSGSVVGRTSPVG